MSPSPVPPRVGDGVGVGGVGVGGDGVVGGAGAKGMNQCALNDLCGLKWVHKDGGLGVGDGGVWDGVGVGGDGAEMYGGVGVGTGDVGVGMFILHQKCLSI